MAGNRTEPMKVEGMASGAESLTLSDIHLPSARELNIAENDAGDDMCSGTKMSDAVMMEDKDSKAETDTEVETDSEVEGGTVSSNVVGKGKELMMSCKKAAKAPEKRRRSLAGEYVCFICFDGGELFICDRKGCNKSYHPICVKRDESYLQAKGAWVCGWHICSICEQADAYYKCYTCLYSLCRGCVKDGVFFSVRRNKGFCEPCFGVVKLIENLDEESKEVEVDFDDKSTFEFLFKEYWVDLKEKLSLSREEIAQAKNPWSSNALTVKEKSLNLNDYAAINAHNINFIYIRRNLMAALLEDIDAFHNKVVGTFVRLRIPSDKPNHDAYRLVQVIGTNKTDEPYQIGRRESNIQLQISELGKSVTTPIHYLSNQPFSEDECKCLRQSMKCGLIERLTVGQVLDKAVDLQEARVTDWLRTERKRLSHLCDRASENGHEKELRECEEKLQLLKTQRLRRLEEVPHIHSDPSMDPSYKSDDEHTETDDNKKEVSKRRKGLSGRRREAIISQRSDSSPVDSWSDTISKTCELHGDPLSKSESSAGLISEDLTLPSGTDAPSLVKATEQTTPINKSLPPATTKGVKGDKEWHYMDPSNKIQGPFSMAQLRRWNDKGYFPPTIRVWRKSEAQSNSVLLTEALAGTFEKEVVVPLKVEEKARGEGSSGTIPAGPAEDSETQCVEQPNLQPQLAPTVPTPNPNQMRVPPTGHQGEPMPRSVPRFGDQTRVAPPWNPSTYYQGPPPRHGAGWVPTSFPRPTFPPPMPPPQPRGSAQSWGAAADRGVSGQWPILPPPPPPQASSVRPWGRQSPFGFKGWRIVCPFYQNGHCKKGASCNHLHI